jgi:hypothetical protein
MNTSPYESSLQPHGADPDKGDQRQEYKIQRVSAERMGGVVVPVAAFSSFPYLDFRFLFGFPEIV